MSSKHRIRSILIVLLLIAVVVTFHIVRRNSTMRGMEVTIVREENRNTPRTELITSEEIVSIITKAYPKLLATDIKDVNKKGIASLLKENPYILNAKVKMTAGGKMLVTVEQREPVARLFYQGGEFYLSRQGTYMPINPKHYCHILVASTEHNEPHIINIEKLNLADTAIHKQPYSPMMLWKLASFLHDNPDYGDLFDQAHLKDNGDLCLIPKLGSIEIIVGDTSFLDTKLEKLWTFFKQGINQTGWEAYSSVNLKYKGQVVAKRKSK